MGQSYVHPWCLLSKDLVGLAMLCLILPHQESVTGVVGANYATVCTANTFWRSCIAMPGHSSSETLESSERMIQHRGPQAYHHCVEGAGPELEPRSELSPKPYACPSWNKRDRRTAAGLVSRMAHVGSPAVLPVAPRTNRFPRDFESLGSCMASRPEWHRCCVLMTCGKPAPGFTERPLQGIIHLGRPAWALCFTGLSALCVRATNPNPPQSPAQPATEPSSPRLKCCCSGVLIRCTKTNNVPPPPCISYAKVPN